jgi:branched-chain amino acid transport system ATP-binding protein
MGEEGSSGGASLFSARDLTVRFGGITALREVSVSIAAGEIVGVIGPNGAGKTTLFNVICGFLRPQEGTLEWKGRPLVGIRPDRLPGLGIARTLQGVGLFRGLSVLENVMAGAERFRRSGIASALLGLPRGERDERQLRDRALGVLRNLDCADVSERMPDELPYPVQKRVALARVLVAEPELLLLDEPAGGLGSEDITTLTGLLKGFGGTTAVMLVEHRMDLVMGVCDRIAVLDYGQLIAEGDPETIGRDQRVLEAYLGREASSDGDGQAGREDG